MTTLTGHAAIEFAAAHNLTLSKYNDPTDDAREGLSVDDASEIAREDASLIYIEIGEDDLISLAENHIKAWSKESPEHRRLQDGFVAWCYDVRTETLAAITDGEDAQIVDDLAYSAKQDDTLRGLDLEEAMREILHYNRRNFVEALRESLAND